MKKTVIEQRFYRVRFLHNIQVIEIIFLKGRCIFKLHHLLSIIMFGFKNVSYMRTACFQIWDENLIIDKEIFCLIEMHNKKVIPCSEFCVNIFAVGAYSELK